MDEQKIKIMPDGPYLVTGNVPLEEKIIRAKGFGSDYKQGKTYPRMQSYALCRCGHSSTMPFCDGHHKQIDFDGTTTLSRIAVVDMGGLNINNLWPNPTGDRLSVTADGPLHDAAYEITDVNGRLVTGFRQARMPKDGVIDVGNLTNGIYVLRIKTKTGVSQSKFVKQ